MKLTTKYRTIPNYPDRIPYFTESVCDRAKSSAVFIGRNTSIRYNMIIRRNGVIRGSILKMS